MPVIVTLVRHGQTTKNLEKKIQTRTDALLSELGVLQAEALGRKLAQERFTRAYCSTLTRTLQTANHILKFNETTVPSLLQDTRVRERDFGDWEDLDVTIIHEASTKHGVRMHKLSPPNGEDYEVFAQKGLDFFLEICKLAESEELENILVVSHGGWILTLFDTLIANADKFETSNLVVDQSVRSPLNTSYSKFEITASQNSETGKYTINFHSVFDSSHLESLTLTQR